jgi:DNA-binding NtrC family response regulator
MSTTPQNAQKPRVLIVDDEEDIQAICSIITSNAGMEPVAFAEPVDAIDFLTGGARVDVLLTDLNLPQMSGLDLAKHVAESQPTLPIVLMTGRHDYIDAAIALGAIPLLKPFSIEQLTTALQDALERGAGSWRQ